jgi:hypothetical protein
MANQKIKTTGTGKRGFKSARWCPRATAKISANKRRRLQDKAFVTEPE